MFVVPENLITARGGWRWRSHSLLLYSSAGLGPTIDAASCYKFITEEEIDLQLMKLEEAREVVGQFYIPISFTAPVLHYWTGGGRPSD